MSSHPSSFPRVSFLTRKERLLDDGTKMDLGGISHVFWYSFLGNQKRCIEPPASCCFCNPKFLFGMKHFFFFKEKGFLQSRRATAAPQAHFGLCTFEFYIQNKPQTNKNLFYNLTELICEKYYLYNSL